MQGKVALLVATDRNCCRRNTSCTCSHERAKTCCQSQWQTSEGHVWSERMETPTSARAIGNSQAFGTSFPCLTFRAGRSWEE